MGSEMCIRDRYFNVDLKDDKSYPFIAITKGDLYPAIKYTRERHKPGTRYFGPYTDSRAARETIDTLRKVMPKSYILVPGYGAQGGKGADLVHFFNEDGLGAIVNSSRGIIAAYQQEKYAQFGAANYADASRQAVIDMREDIAQALQGRK